MDGGTVWNTNLVSAVHRCREIVSDDSQITLDIVICGGSGAIDITSDVYNAYSNFMRYKTISDYHYGI